MNCKKFFPSIFIMGDMAYSDMECTMELCAGDDIVGTALVFEENGADGMVIYDCSDDDISHEKAILYIRAITKTVDIPVYAGGNIKRLEDVKKYLYAGARFVLIHEGTKDTLTGDDIFTAAIERFGADRMAKIEANRIALLQDGSCSGLYIYKLKKDEDYIDVLMGADAAGVTGPPISTRDYKFYLSKQKCEELGIPVNTIATSVPFGEFKVNDDGLIPVIVQDYKTDEVLMMAWMNEESFKRTLETGVMTYYSRSRNEIWVKGETSGHFQFVRAMSVDCDKDTLLAKVKQVGAACHTGKKSCFYTELFSKEYDESNPLKVFSEVMELIEDRKNNPKEGSYTNYLFDHGIDKILKKCGEEASEIIIAAKNTDPEEIKYEIADFLYHLMVLMSLKGVSWEDIIKELANR